MSAMIFKLNAEPDQRLDLSALTPDRLSQLDEAAINALPVSTAKTRLTVGDVFRLTMGETSDIRIAGGSARLDGVGTGLKSGRLVVEGDVGLNAGRAMTGGELRITGSVGPHAGSAMTGGLLHIGADAGDYLGAPQLGEMVGMRGGTIVVTGRAGARAGDRMRRGMILVGGDCGDFPASRMIAGTLAIFGDCGRMPGYLMRRGTMLLGGKAAALAPTFSQSGVVELTVLRLIMREAKALLPTARVALFDGPVRRRAGDLATLGKGEIIQPAG